MSCLTDFLKPKLLDLIFSGTVWSSRPTTLYLGLLTATPTASTPGTEVTGGGYSRLGKAATSSFWTVSGLTVTNAAAFAFGMPTGDLGTVTAVGIYDAPSGGNLLMWAPITPQSVPRGYVFEIAAGDFDLVLDGNYGDYGGNKLLLLLFNGTAFPSVATHYFALGTGGASSGVTGEHTIGNNGYTRAVVTNNPTNWPAASAGVKANGAAITWGAPSGAWASSVALSHFAIMDASSSGNCLWCQALSASITVSGAGAAPNFGAAGDLETTIE